MPGTGELPPLPPLDDDLDDEVGDPLAGLNLEEDEDPDPDEVQGAVPGFSRPSQRRVQPALQTASDLPSAPLWGKFHHLRGTGESYQLRIQRVEYDGARHELGYIEPDATIEHLVGRACEACRMMGWPIERAAAKYKLTAFDSNGRRADPEEISVNVPVDHPIILEFKKRVIEGDVGPGIGQTAIPGTPMNVVWDFLREQTKAAAAREAEIRSQVGTEVARERKTYEFLLGEHQKIADDRVNTVMKAQEELNKASESVWKRAVSQEEIMRNREVAMVETMKGRELSLAEAARLQQQTFMDGIMKWQQTLADDAVRRAEERAKEAERLATERERIRLEAAERDRVRDQEHQKAMSEVWRSAVEMKFQAQLAQIQQSSPLGGLGQIGQLKEVFGTLKEIFDKDDDGDDAGDDRPKTVVDRVFDLLEKGIGALVPKPNPDFDRAVAARAATEAQAEQRQIEQKPDIPDIIQTRNGPIVAMSPEHLAQAAQPNGAGKQTEDQSPTVIQQEDPVNNLPIDVRKKARRILGVLIEQLVAEPDRAKWGDLFRAAVMNDPPAIDAYLRAAGLRRALDELQAPPEITTEIIGMLKALPAGQVPPEIFK